MTAEQKINKMMTDYKNKIEDLFFRSELSEMIRFVDQFADESMFHHTFPSNKVDLDVSEIWHEHVYPMIASLAPMMRERSGLNFFASGGGLMIALPSSIEPCSLISNVDWEKKEVDINYDAIAIHLESEYANQSSIADCFRTFLSDLRK